MSVTNNLAQVQKNNVKSTEFWQKLLFEMIKLEKSNFVFTTLGDKLTIPTNQGTTTTSALLYRSIK